MYNTCTCMLVHVCITIVHVCIALALNPSSIDLILTNKFRSFQNSLTLETGLSDHHKLTTTVMRSFFPKQAPLHIIYRDFKNYDHTIFRN